MKRLNKKSILGLIAIIVIIVIIVFVARASRKSVPASGGTKSVQKSTETVVPISIRSEDIKEENFTGTKPVIVGLTPIAKAAQAYVAEEIAEFKKSADEEVPDMKKQFSADNATSNYTIDIKAQYKWYKKTESIIVDEYAYTGGAHGSSLYKVFTAIPNGKLVSLSDVIPTSKRAGFISLVKNELMKWRPEGSEEVVVFENEVKNLKFDSLGSWSLDDQSLVLYFDQYEIGPGVLGAVVFPLPIEKVKSFINPNFL